MGQGNKIALITGGTQGIGLGIAESFLQKNINVIVTSRELERAQKTSNFLKEKYNVDTMGIAFDIEKQQSIRPLIENIVEKFGQLDILVNNALSQNCIGTLDSYTDQQITEALSVNITNTLLLSKACFPLLKRSNGNIVNITSVIVNKYLIGLPLYAIVKGALVQMSKTLAAEWAEHKIRVNAVNPGFIQTRTEEQLKAEGSSKNYDFYIDYCPIGRIGQPKDIGELVAFIASESASFMTGAVIDEDGGYSIQGLPLS